MWEFLLDIVFPRQCLGCGKFGQYFCAACVQDKIDYFANQVCPYCERTSPYGFTHPSCTSSHCLDGMFVLAHYHGLIPQAVHEIKYLGAYAVLSELAGLIINNFHFQYKFNYLVPVPLSEKRLRQRGFNQAEKLANELNRLLIARDQYKSVKVINLLVRNRETKPQFSLKLIERRGNVKNAFSLNQNLMTRDLRGFSFCLVDDVATTGATIFECSKVLKKSGADKVWAITIARGG